MSWSQSAAKYGLELTAFSAIAFVVGLIAMRYAVIYLPADYFSRTGSHANWWPDQHPTLRWVLIIGKNVFGVLFLVVGAAMLVLPGPGVMMLLLGLALVDMPGKRRLEQWLISFPAVHRKIDKMRVAHGHPPLELPPRSDG